MNTETLELPHGYTARIALDESPANPWESWDGQPPLTVFYDRSLTHYGDEQVTVGSLFDMIPDAQFQTCKGRREVLEALPDVTRREYANALRDCYSAPIADRARDAMAELLPEEPSGWRSASDYFDCMEALAGLAGIACYSGQSSGYSQGDSARVFVALTPAWREKVGNPTPEHDAGNLQGAFELYSAWAWGDVYGVASIHRPATEDEDGGEIEGDEIGDGSCWGFYGSDHAKSGLMEHCLSIVKYDLEQVAKETVAAHEAACRDIATV